MWKMIYSFQCGFFVYTTQYNVYYRKKSFFLLPSISYEQNIDIDIYVHIFLWYFIDDNFRNHFCNKLWFLVYTFRIGCAFYSHCAVKIYSISKYKSLYHDVDYQVIYSKWHKCSIGFFSFHETKNKILFHLNCASDWWM